MVTKNIRRFVVAAALMGGAIFATPSADAASSYVALAANSVTGKVVTSIAQSEATAKQKALERCKGVSSDQSAPYCKGLTTCGSGWYAYVRIFHGHGWGFGATCGHASEEAAMQQARNICNKARGGANCKYTTSRL